MAASAAGFGAHAQEPAQPEANVPLPPLEVTTQKAAPKAKAKPKKSTASSTAAPVPQAAPAAAAPPPATTPSEQLGLTPASGNTNQSGTGLGRLPGTLQDTPQIVNVVPQKIIEEQKITTIDQALRTVPGVTVAIGEGGGGLNGDQFRIRGFQAKGDLYIDGLRDFGVYVRDAFAYEQVEVFKGPSSMSFGQGTGGGVINLSQKTAHLGDSTSIEGTVGSGSYARGIVDINKQINATTAARAVMMYHEQDIVDRDHVYSDRKGFLGSLAFGLGTDTTFTLNYLHQDGERMPEYGVPMLPKSGVLPASKSNPGTPITEFLVPRSNFYGKATDHDETSADILTARFKSQVSKDFMVYSDTRLAFYDRDFASGPAECANNFPAGAGNDCQTHYKAGDYAGSVINYGGGNPGYEQETWGAQNITGFLAKVNTGGLKHEIVAGIDAYYQNNERDTWFVQNGPLGGKQPTVTGPNSATLLNPVFENVTGYYLYHDANANNGRREADATNFAVFASDRIWLTKEFSFLGGVRWDDYNANYGFRCNVTTDTNTTPIDERCNEWRTTETSTEFWSPKLSFIWEPSEQETYYVSWARSFTPAGTFISNEVNAIGVLPGQNALDPEVSETWEAGAKYNLLNNKLGLTAAVFQITKDNASYTDSQGDSVPSGEVQRVRGFELGVSGQVTRAWFLQSSYAYLDSEIIDAKTLRTGTGVCSPGVAGCNGNSPQYVDPIYDPATTIGNKVQQAPENAFNIWTTYNLSTLFYTGPGKLTAGGGVTYVDGYFTTSANNNAIPHQLTFDGLVQYEVDHWKFALNGYNLTDELYYTEAFSNRATPAPGRTVLFTAGTKF